MNNRIDYSSRFGVFSLDMLSFVCRKISFHSRKHFVDDPLPPHSSFRITSKGPFFYPHHSSFAVLKHQAREGCNFCVQIIASAWPMISSDREKELDSQIWLYYRLIDASSLPRAIGVSCGAYHASIDLLTIGKTLPMLNIHRSFYANRQQCATYLSGSDS